jgi:hypothetical protein
MKRLFLLCALILSGCATITSTDKYADGRSTTTTIFEVGRSEAITAFNDTTTKDGRAVSVGAVKSDVNVQALQATTGAIGSIVGEALKAYTGKP